MIGTYFVRSALIPLVMALMLLLTASVTAGPVVIEYWHPYGPPWGDLWERMADNFNQAHGDIQIEMVMYGGGLDQLQTAVATGVGPDVAHVWGIAPAYSLADAKMLLPLDTYFRKERVLGCG